MRDINMAASRRRDTPEIGKIEKLTSMVVATERESYTIPALDEGQERALFEAWYESDAMPLESDWFKRDPDDPGEYLSGMVYQSWESWKAGRAELRKGGVMNRKTKEDYTHKYLRTPVPGVINGEEVSDIGPWGCYNRPPLATSLLVQDGWTPDGRRNMVEIPNTMSTNCKQVEHGYAQMDNRCTGCTHLLHNK